MSRDASKLFSVRDSYTGGNKGWKCRRRLLVAAAAAPVVLRVGLAVRPAARLGLAAPLRPRGRRSRRGGAAAGEKAKPEDKPVKTWKKAKLVPNSTRLTVGDKEELPLEAMHVVVRIEGFRARVLLDCSYKNDRDRQLEGSFQLRLPDGAAPYFLAFGETVMAADDGNLMIEIGGAA